MSKRIRVQAPIDSDAVSPDSIAAAQQFITSLITERAETNGVALNWNTFRIYVRNSRRKKAMIVTGWVRVAR